MSNFQLFRENKLHSVGLLQAKVALFVATEGEKRNTFNHLKFSLFFNTNIASTRFQLIRDSFHHFDWKKCI